MITKEHKGRVPKFRIDPETGTMSTKGTLVRDENGNVKMTPGYKVWSSSRITADRRPTPSPPCSEQFTCRPCPSRTRDFNG